MASVPFLSINNDANMAFISARILRKAPQTGTLYMKILYKVKPNPKMVKYFSSLPSAILISI